MRHARSSSCYRRSTASAGKVASRLQGGQAIVGNAQGSDTATGEQHSSTRTRCRGARIAVSQAVVVGGLISLHPLTLGRNHDILDAAHRRWLRVWGWLCGPPARLTDLVRSIAERDA
jgi:hypothetical protein